MTAQADVGYQARQHGRWQWSEAAFWVLTLACVFLFPSRYLIMTEIVRLALFALTFAFGCGLAGLGGALSAEILGLDPYFPLKFMIYFLIVVTVGGSSSITGPFLASLLLGIADVAGKYYVPKMGPFVIYTLMIVILI